MVEFNEAWSAAVLLRKHKFVDIVKGGMVGEGEGKVGTGSGHRKKFSQLNVEKLKRRNAIVYGAIAYGVLMMF